VSTEFVWGIGRMEREGKYKMTRVRKRGRSRKKLRKIRREGIKLLEGGKRKVME
jgi:hypothetical protein